jgi:hypothetical protein
VNGRGGWDGDMPNLPRPSRGDVPPAGDAAYEALLGGSPLPADADEGLRPLAAAMASLTVAPSARELASERDARAAFRGGFSPATRPARAGRRRTRGVRRRNRVLASVLSAKLAAVATLTAGVLTAGAYAGVLPAPVQSFAHHALGAPAPHPAGNPAPPKPPPGPAPAPARPGARGLCQAYAKGHGNARQKAMTFRELVAAAGGTARVTAYCAGLAHPAKTPPGQQASHAAGKPSAASSHTPAAHSTHKPTSHPSHPPRSHPTHPGHPPDSHPSRRGHNPASRPASHW